MVKVNKKLIKDFLRSLRDDMVNKYEEICIPDTPEKPRNHKEFVILYFKKYHNVK